MEARVKLIEGRVDGVTQDVSEIREDVHRVREAVVVLEDRQKRFHDDINNLTDALGVATTEVTKLNTWVNRRGAFLAGATFVFGIIASVVTGALAIMKDWFTG